MIKKSQPFWIKYQKTSGGRGGLTHTVCNKIRQRRQEINTDWTIDPFLVAFHTMAREDPNIPPSIVNAAIISPNFTRRTQLPELTHIHSNM